jgi:hypothetical protein
VSYVSTIHTLTTDPYLNKIVNKLKIRSFVVNSIICPKAENLNIKPRKTHLYNITNIQFTNLRKHRLFTLPLY